jgi:hypothetical protein
MLRFLENVANARPSDDVLRTAGIFADLLPEAGYGYLQDVGIAAILLPPHLRQKVILGYGFAGVPCQKAENAILRGREKDFIRPRRHAMLGKVYDEIARNEWRLRHFLGEPGAAENSSDASQEFIAAERFDHIVIGSLVEAVDDVLAAALCGQHQDGHIRELADSFAYLETVQPGHHDIENNKRGLLILDHLQSGLALAGGYDLVALEFQIQCDQFEYPGVIVNNQD